MATEQELFAQVEEAVRTVLNTEEGEITMDSMLRADLDTESIDFLDITYEIEKRTGIEIDLQEVLNYLNEKKGEEIADVTPRDLIEFIIETKNG
jgi:acyl carrier protein